MKVEKRLAIKSLQADKKRNFVAVAAIVLTTLLFTVLLTTAGSIAKSNRMMELRASGSKSYATIKYLSDADYEKLRLEFGEDKVGFRIFVSAELTNTAFAGKQIEMSYMDENYMSTHFCLPSEGDLPVRENEIVCDELTLNDLGVSHSVGQEITIRFRMRGEEYKEEFVVAGIIESDEYARQSIIVSRAFTDRYAGILQDSFAVDNEYTGIRMMDIDLGSGLGGDKKIEAVLRECGYNQDIHSANYLDVNYNPAYEKATEPDITLLAGGCLLIFVFMLTGYLIIYNLFEISIARDIHFWGTLRMTGAGRRAVKKIISYQALALSVIGIPIGILLGGVIGRILFPIIIRTTTIDSRLSEYGLSIGSAAATAAFVVITVIISANKSGKKAQSISPVEAVRFTGCNVESKIKKKNTVHSKGGRKKSFGFAFANVKRNRRRTALVILSLSLSLILFNATVILANGIDKDKYLRSKMKTDFVVANESYFDLNKHFRTADDGLDGRIVEEIESRPEFREGGAIYAYTPIGKTEFLFPNWEENLKTDEEGKQYIVTDTGIQYQARDGLLSCQLYGAEKAAIRNFEITEGLRNPEELTEKMNSGKYVILSGGDGREFKIGDKVKLMIDGTPREYELLARMDQGRMEYCRFTTTGYCFYLSSDELKNIGTPTLMNYSFNVNNIVNIEKFLEQNCSRAWTATQFVSAGTYYEAFYNLKAEFLILGILLSAVIGIIGLMNFANVILTSIFNRQREIAVMQSIGLTNGKLRQMLCAEGLIYSLLALCFALISGIVLIPLISAVIGGMMEFYSGRLTLMPSFCLWWLYLLISLIVPVIGEKMITGKSVTERLKTV